MKKYILILSSLINIAVIIYVARHVYFKYYLFPKQKINTTSQPYIISYSLNRDKLYKSLPNDENEIIFAGDSHTQRFPFDEIFKDKRIKNRGIDGDITKGIYQRLDEIIESKPIKVFILVGINDINRGIQIDTIIHYYSIIIDKIKRFSPKTKILIQNVIPVVTHNQIGYSNEKLKRLNEEILELAKDKKIEYIDLYSKFKINDEANPEFFCDDGVHLSPEGYFLWADIIRVYL